jgi:5-methylcytosine-specific restriction endonuclease McrA
VHPNPDRHKPGAVNEESYPVYKHEKDLKKLLNPKSKMMTLLTREEIKDHPEQYFDRIREYESTKRYIPTPLEDLLYEQAGHRCTICQAPWLEIHHILPLNEKGITEYENLIVLCPNCHTQVHKQNSPDQDQLRHYKAKLEVAFAFPVYSKISGNEWDLIEQLVRMKPQELFEFEIFRPATVRVSDKEADPIRNARNKARIMANFTQLITSGIVEFSFQNFNSIPQQVAGGLFEYSYTFSIRLSEKGLRWIKYMSSRKIEEIRGYSNQVNF